ncbi:uncharacterized protein LOC136016455 [Lathamus discolor]|uniref:uncharacterized protein LOC136016455 n=1 Tax=Lathamus discolor TaxID=678569 RepID=UPI0032B7557D
MAKASVETLLQPTEIRGPVEPPAGNHTQPASSRAKLSLTSSQSLAEPVSVSFLSTEFPMGAATPHHCGLRRTFACTNLLLLLSLADDEEADDAEEEDDADRKAPPIPPAHRPSSMDTTKPATPLQRQFRTQSMAMCSCSGSIHHHRLAHPTEEDGTWCSARRCRHHPSNNVLEPCSPYASPQIQRGSSLGPWLQLHASNSLSLVSPLCYTG